MRAQAEVCRYCRYEFRPSAGIEQNVSAVPWKYVGIAAATLAVTGTVWLSYSVWRDLEAVRVTAADNAVASAQAYTAADLQPQLQQLALGSTLEWTADSSFGDVVRQAGPYVLTITKREEDEMATPVLKLSVGTQSVTLEGEMASPTVTNRITLLSNRSGAVPVVMLQSFSGGAHCCNHVQLAGFSSGKLKVVDLGLWDGDETESPKDISRDGIADFQMVDNRFFYAFAPYAMSYAPPKILNVVGGKVVDVSARPEFKALFAKAMQDARSDCLNSSDGAVRNGACAAYVAEAARAGRLSQAWSDMLGGYDASQDWDWPAGCWVSDESGCPSGQEIVYKSYPEALLAFLKDIGYVPKNWTPPEFRPARENRSPDVPDDRTA